MEWLRKRAPGLHHALTRDDRPWPAVREITGGVLLILVILGGLWLYTGQPLGTSPVVVVESGSMMHCDGGPRSGSYGCEGPYGRLGTIDPGDLVLVQDIDGPGDVETMAEDGESRYGKSGDVIVYRTDGDGRRTPIIHRALFYLEIHGPGDYSIAALGLHHIRDLADPSLYDDPATPGADDSLLARMTNGRGWARNVMQDCTRPEQSGFVTRGDNNAKADQEGGGGDLPRCPVQPGWIVGKARGEIPWVGLLKLKVSDWTSGTTHYADAPGDLKVMLFVSIAVLVGGPIAWDQVARMRRNRKEKAEAGAAKPGDGPDTSGGDGPKP